MDPTSRRRSQRFSEPVRRRWARRPRRQRRRNVPCRRPAEPVTTDDLIRGAAQDLEDYQRLTAEGRLGEAGQRLESLKQKLQQLQTR